MPRTLLVVEDDADAREAVRDMLSRAGHRAVACGSAEEALRALSGQEFDLLVTDVHLPALDGLRLCEHVVDNYPGMPVVIMTAFGDLPTAVGAIRAAAFGFLSKPFTAERLGSVVDHALAARRADKPMRRLPEELDPEVTMELLGSSAVMGELRARIQRVARSASAVLIAGESGTGKELIARALHQCSARRDGPWVAINCAAIPGELLAAELFGHTRGAFTDATDARGGVFDRAHRGTLFLDEIGSMPWELQGSLLRVLDDGSIRPVGGTEQHVVDVRVVAATNRSLSEGVRMGTFRADLLFRLSGVELRVPPLRERGDDVRELAEHFLGRWAQANGTAPPVLAPEAVAALRRHHWPGNVRELQNAVHAALAFASSSRVGVEDLPASVRAGADPPLSTGRDRNPSLEEVERRHIERVLTAVGGNKAEAARRLGIDRTTLYRKLKKLGLEPTGT